MRGLEGALSGNERIPGPERRRPSTGAAHTSSTTRTAARLTTGRRITARAIPDQTRPSSPAESTTRPRNGTRSAFTLSPRSPRSAGTSVSAAKTETSPTVSAPTPRLRRTESGTRSSPHIASTKASPLEVVVRAAVASHRHVEAASARVLDDPLHDPSAVLAVAGEPYRNDEGVPVPGDEPRVLRLVEALRVVHCATRADLVEDLLEPAPEGNGADLLALRADDDELVGVLGVRIGRKVPVDQRVALLRLRVGRDVPLGREVEERDHEADSEHEHDDPRTQGEPRMARTPTRQVLGREAQPVGKYRAPRSGSPLSILDRYDLLRPIVIRPV